MTATHDTAPTGAFSQRITVCAADVDPIGHANNVVYVQWVQDVAIAHSQHVGLDWQAYQSIGAIFVVRKHEIEYLSPALEGETLEATTWVGATRGAVSLRHTMFHRPGGTLGTRALTTWVLRDFRSGRPRRILPELIGRFNGRLSP
jgi:acyl-CoA thioester hydrolase